MPLLSVYNNLIHGYVMSRQTRYDSHKRSELSDIHNRIRKLSAEQPLYKINFDEEAQEYTLTVKEYAMGVAAAVKDLANGEAEGAFSRYAIKSDNPAYVGVEVLEGSDPKKTEDFGVEVEKLSSHQFNVGNMVESKTNSLVSGQYNFKVEIEGNFYSFQFNVSGSNDNRELQTKLADFINKTKVGLRAEVVTDRENGRSGLNLEAKKDGVDFIFTDTKTPEGTNSGIVDFFGLNNVRNKAEKTVAVVDGERIESEDRKIVTSKGLLLDIKRETNGNKVMIRKIADDESVFRKVSEFVRKYNEFINYVKDGALTRRASKKLWYEMNNFFTKEKETLEENGIMYDFAAGEGNLNIDREKMASAVQNGTLEKLFKADSEMTGALLKKLSDVTLNPMEYVDKIVVVYPNTKNNLSYNPYITSLYSGMMYNNYC
ncbi:MAG: hypothetical protein K6G60_07350 [Lachnospiraceae bacterium]|nr:hypothetical protein [Lachnospiraceae bacterium]